MPVVLVQQIKERQVLLARINSTEPLAVVVGLAGI